MAIGTACCVFPECGVFRVDMEMWKMLRGDLPHSKKLLARFSLTEFKLHKFQQNAKLFSHLADDAKQIVGWEKEASS